MNKRRLHPVRLIANSCFRLMNCLIYCVIKANNCVYNVHVQVIDCMGKLVLAPSCVLNELSNYLIKTIFAVDLDLTVVCRY